MTRILVPSGALGLGFDAAALARGVANGPDLIAIDGGSTDSGPSYLGRGVSKYSRASTKAEWGEIIAARAEAGCPLVIGTAGTCGADDAVEWLYQITREILAEQGLTAKVAVLKSEQEPARVAQALADGKVRPLGNAPEISDALVRSCSHIVALAGAEQIAAALGTGAEIIIAGRTTDTAIIAALPILRGDNAGAAWHGAKVGECGALCTRMPQTGVIQVDIDATGFTITPLAAGNEATPHTVSAHMLYENTDPFILYEPGGHLDVTGAEYRAAGDGAVRVEGSVWVPSPDYTVKLEGARAAGFQTISLTTIRDRHYVTNARAWTEDILARHRAKAEARLGLAPDDFSVELRLIGVDSTLGALENRAGAPVEIGVLAVVTAATQARAGEIAKLLNPYLLHHALTEAEEMPTFAFPFSPAEIDRGEAWEFCLNHVMHLADPMAAFRLELRNA